MFHQNRFDGFIGQKPPFGMAAPIKNQTCHPIIPLVKPCSSTALRSYPSAYSSRLGSLILANQSNCSGMIFYLLFRPSRRYIIPAKFLVPTGTAFTASPGNRFPVIPGRLHLSRWCQPSSSRCAARTCRLPGFYFWFYSGGIYLVIYKTGNSIFLWWIYLFSYERTIILSSLSWHSWIWTSGLFVLSWTLWLCKFYPARIFSA